MRAFPVCLVSVFALCLSIGPAIAGVDGQPQPDAALKAKLQNAAYWFVRPQKNVGRERADFLMLLEKSPEADITDLIAPSLRDDAAYQGAIATFQDALDAAKDDKTKLFLRYNIARTHLLRGRIGMVRTIRNPYADLAAQALEPFDTHTRDAALWELYGDIAADRGMTEIAIAAYQRIAASGGSNVLIGYKTGLAWQRARRFSEAQTAYQKALERDAASGHGRGEYYHLLYQALASLYIEQRDYHNAVFSLTASSKIKTETQSFPFRLDIARVLLKQGFQSEVAAYAQAALKQTPNDPDAAELLAEAGGR